MNKMYTLLACSLLLASTLSAKTYTIISGKWTNEDIWGCPYPGTTVKTGDTVIITGSVVLTSPVVVEGYLKVMEGASLVGASHLSVAFSGTFVNDGNTAMESITNEGTVINNRSMDAINNIDNRGKISNGSNMAAGNDFNNSGTIEGKKSTTCFAQNNLVSSPDSKFGTGVRFFANNTIETQAPAAERSTGAMRQPE